MFTAMREVSARLKLALYPSDPGYFDIYSTVSATGTYEGHQIILERQAALYTFHTRVVLDPIIPFRLSVKHEGLVAKLARAVGVRDVQIGDKDFDAEFQIAASDLEQLKRLLTPELKDALRTLDQHGGKMQVTDLFVDVQRTFMIGELWSGEQLLLDLDPCVRAARAIEDAVRRLG